MTNRDQGRMPICKLIPKGDTHCECTVCGRVCFKSTRVTCENLHALCGVYRTEASVVAALEKRPRCIHQATDGSPVKLSCRYRGVILAHCDVHGRCYTNTVGEVPKHLSLGVPSCSVCKDYREQT